jgi:hypothetical protein
MKTETHIDLREVAIGGIGSPETRYYANDKRVSREEFRAIKDGSTLECMSNANVNGVTTFYSVARKAVAP